MTGSYDPQGLEALFGNPENFFLPEDLVLSDQARRVIFLSAYRELAPVLGEKVAVFPPSEEDFRARVGQYLERNRDQLHQKLCVEFDYCRKRRDYASHGRLLAFLIALGVFLFDLKTGGLSTATWMIVTGELDRFCGCAQAPTPPVPA